MTDEPASVPQQDDDPPEGASLARTRAVDPQKLLRIAGVVRIVLDEARRIRPEPGAVQHLQSVLDRINDELKDALPPELYKELDDLTPDVKEGTLEELALAHAEILGWLEGLFQGTQLALQLHAAQALAERPGPPQLGRRQRDSDETDSRYL
jgi:hypothetical protein